jgi:DNA-binding SARP family transcriptional activator/type II secretory pathway predicted ATPase ExeA/HEPN domain-containing protein
MPGLKLFLFGPPRLERDGALVTVERRKVSALLAYLAATGQTHSRDALATLFWPDADQSHARGALRRDLSVLHGLLAEHLLTQGQTVSVRAATGLWIDVAEFRRLMAVCQTHAHAAGGICPECVAALAEAVTLYRDDFLAGFTLRDSPDFDEWQLLQTEQLRREFASALERLAQTHGSRQEFERAIAYARRWLMLDPLHELAHRQLMQLYAWSGQRAAALRQYEECVRVLERELGVAPEPETIRLYQMLKDYQTLPSSMGSFGFTDAETRRASILHKFLGSPKLQKVSDAPFDRIVRGRMVGRERELAQASALWQRATTGQGLTLTISGEPGVGKTQLARELMKAAAAMGGRVLLGECHAEGGAPYALFAQMIRATLDPARGSLTLSETVLADLLTLAPTLRPLYPQVQANPPLEPKWEQERIFDSVAALCDAIAAQTPLLLCVEDVHWADSGALALLRHLARRARGRRWLLVMTYREAELEANQALRDLCLELNRERLAEQVTLKRLDREQTRELLAALLATGGEISSAFLDGIFRETEGNPFFVEEVCKALIAEGKLYYAEGQWRRAEMSDIAIPQSVRDAILSRVEKLSPPVQESLRCAAVLGRTFDFEALKSLTGSAEEALVGALEQSARAQLIGETHSAGQVTFTFAHALIPFALRESIHGLRLQRLHRRAVTAIEQLRPDDVEALAHHSLAGGERDKAIQYAQQAAERALKLYAYDVAAQHLRRALDLLAGVEASDTRIAVLERLADVHELLGQRVEAVLLYQQALEGWRALPSADKWTAVRLYRKTAETFVRILSHADTERFFTSVRLGLEAALRLVEGEPPHRETVRLLAVFGKEYWNYAAPQNWELSAQRARAAVQMAEQLDAPAEHSVALAALVVTLGAQERYRERAQAALQRVAITHDPRFADLRERMDSLFGAADSLMYVGDYAQAQPFLRQAETLSEQMRDFSYLAYALMKQGECGFYLDRWDEVLDFAKRRQALVQAYGVARIGRQCFYCGITSSVYALRGEQEQSAYWRSVAMDYMCEAIGADVEKWPRAGRY